MGRPWLCEDVAATRKKLDSGVKKFHAEYKTDNSVVVSFRKQLAIVHVYMSNNHERTLPTGSDEQATYKILEDVYDDVPDFSNPPSDTWDAEGKGSTSSKPQMKQHFLALMYLTTKCTDPSKNLTFEDVMECHRILMNGAVESDGSRVQGGQIRTTPACAGQYVYAPPNVCEKSLKYYLDEYNAMTDTDYILRAVYLFYQLITIHPFTNGNGRLCRLILACALQRGGFPFQITLSSGHKSARQHYLQSIIRARMSLDGDMETKLSDLMALTLTSMYSHLANFYINAEYDKI